MADNNEEALPSPAGTVDSATEGSESTQPDSQPSTPSSPSGQERWEQFVSSVKPYADHYGLDSVVRSVPTLLAVNNVLLHGTPEQKRQLVQNIISDYQVALDNTNQAQAQDPGDDLDPNIRSALERLEALERRVVGSEQARHAAEIQAFSSDPKNKHFNRVAETMAKLIRGQTAKNLQEAYDQAILLDSELRNQLSNESDTDTRRAAADAARRGSANIRPSTGKPAKPLSAKPAVAMRDFLLDEFERISKSGAH